MSDSENGGPAKQAGKFLGSLRDALAAASRDEPQRKPEPAGGDEQPPKQQSAAPEAGPPPLPSAAEAAREARGGTPNIPPVRPEMNPPVEMGAPPTTRVVRPPAPTATEETPVRTQLVRGKLQVQRGEFSQDPVVGWLVVVGGNGIGAYRPIFEGNNSIGRSPSNRIAVDFDDEAISSEEQAWIRYDSSVRNFLLVPNLSKTNVVSINEKRPTAAVELQAMDVITMGRTQLVFVPFCGPEFDWGELAELKS